MKPANAIVPEAIQSAAGSVVDLRPGGSMWRSAIEHPLRMRSADPRIRCAGKGTPRIQYWRYRPPHLEATRPRALDHAVAAEGRDLGVWKSQKLPKDLLGL